MMRLKARQSALPDKETAKKFVPTRWPEFTGDGKDKYYFDIKNNKDHYAMLTNDMTD